MNVAELENVRRLVLSTLASLGMPRKQWFLVTDAHPPRHDEVIGEAIPVAGLRVVWLVDKQRLEFYYPDGRLMTTVPVGELAEERKAV
jgi:hypothetical protein